MILRKPYAFFIKMFKPIHFIFAICTGILITNQNRIVTFLNNYLYSSSLLDTKNIRIELINPLFYIIPIFLLLLTLLMFGIMYRKNKPSKFYFITIFIFLSILVVNIYTYNFLSILQETTVAIKIIKLIHDLLLLTIIIESFLMIVYIVRGLGINFKKFDFSSDISKFDIEEKDKEEFELEVKFDFNETKRKKNEKIRKLKYFYLEHKLITNIALCIIPISIICFAITIIFKNNNYNKENTEYNLYGFNLIVNNTYLLNANYEGIRITNNYLVVVDVKLNSFNNSKSLFSQDFTLKIGNAKIFPTRKYYDYLKDIGSEYNNTILSSDYQNYIFAYEISPKYITSDMYLRYTYQGQPFDVKLNPKNLIYGNKTVEAKIEDTIDFTDSLGDIKFKVKNYEIDDYYKINYNYCLNTNNCFDSIEYLRPSINEDYDKTIIKLDIEYEDNSKLALYSFYNLLNNFGDIYYKKDNEWKIQSEGFEQIISKKGKDMYCYIGIDEEIKEAESIKFIFNIRGIKYEYLLK